MAGMKVLISGAGIAGNALAFWMSKMGHNVTVLERFPSLRASGLQLDLRGHGIEVMRRMGLEEAFQAKKAPEQGLEIVGGSGMRWAYFAANTSDKGLQGFTTDFEIMRGDMCQILHDATKDRVKYVFGTSVKSLEEKPGSVEVQFEDGTSGQFDLVVGADGQRSRIRKILMAQEKSDGYHALGTSCIAYVTIPRPIQNGENYRATVYMTTGGRSIMVRRHSPDLTQAYLSCDLDQDRLNAVHSEGVEAQKQAVGDFFKDAGWRSDEIIESMMQDNDFYLQQMAVVKLDHWHRGRIGLVGDAAYCPSANTGMGTTSAMVGAYILAGEIDAHCRQEHGKEQIEAALQEYDRKFRPFMDQVQRGMLEGGAVGEKMPQGPFGIFLLKCLMGAASLLKVDVLSRFVLREDIKDWSLPDYEHMVKV